MKTASCMHADAETIKKNISNILPRMVYNIS
jgi:hypothetical protein